MPPGRGLLPAFQPLTLQQAARGSAPRVSSGLAGPGRLLSQFQQNRPGALAPPLRDENGAAARFDVGVAMVPRCPLTKSDVRASRHPRVLPRARTLSSSLRGSPGGVVTVD